MSVHDRHFCRTCGDPIGSGTSKNIIYSCDRHLADEDEWCGKCFSNKPCGRGAHGEGCQTMALCGDPSPARIPQESE